MVKRAVFLDRDGVINANIERNGRSVAPASLAEFRIFPGVQSAVRRLKRAGFLVIVVTNQPDVAAGRTARETVEAMHAAVRKDIEIDDILVCYHAEADGCTCRKPRPGMMVTAAARHAVVLGRSYVVGDRWRDIEAGRASGCFTILVGEGRSDERSIPNEVVRSLPDAVYCILAREGFRVGGYDVAEP
jgi:D-glycero-D-manno-heptose 1,7-bisphosphate phosphatase